MVSSIFAHVNCELFIRETSRWRYEIRRKSPEQCRGHVRACALCCHGVHHEQVRLTPHDTSVNHWYNQPRNRHVYCQMQGKTQVHTKSLKAALKKEWKCVCLQSVMAGFARNILLRLMILWLLIATHLYLCWWAPSIEGHTGWRKEKSRCLSCCTC